MKPTARSLLRLFAALLLATLSAGMLPARAVAQGTGAEGSRLHDQRTFTIAPDQPAFGALPGARAFHGIHPGIHGDAGYRIEVPDNWNGVLVMYAHGYRGTGAALTVSNPALRQHLIDNGYAWAASSYSANYYDVRAGVEDTNALALAFPQLTGLPAPTKYYMTGHSMGGHITAAAIEREALETARSRVRYAGAVPMCGVMGDVELYSYFLAFNHAAHQLAGFPPRTLPLTTHPDLLPEIRSVLWVDYEADRGAVTAQGERLRAILMNLSGGDRPIFAESFPTFMDQLLGYGAIEGTWSGMVIGDILNTQRIVYQFDADPALTPGERAFNESIFRASGNAAAANPRRTDGVRWIPLATGQFDIPVVSIHTLGDLFVPFAMQQIYARRARDQGSDRWLVQRAIRGPAHCQFAVEEEIAAFDAMVRWETQGIKPEGDDVLDPVIVANPQYGCTFTTRQRPGLPACKPE
jgi:pimeloyl-ACP methyl ester carboxylesterase